MKVFQIIQKKQYRGAEIFGAQLSEHLVKSGHDVMLCSIYDGDAKLPFSGEVLSLGRPKNKRYWDFYGWKKLASIIKEFNPDILQANASDTLKYAVMSKLFFRWETPIVYRNASLPSFYIRGMVTKMINGFLLRKTQIIVSVSKASKKDLNTLYPFTAGKNIVIPVGIEEAEEHGRVDESCSTKIQNESYKQILHLGSFTSEKNHLELLQIFRHILQRQEKVILNFGGGGPLEEKVKQEVDKLGLSEKVNFLGEIMDPLSVMHQCDVLVLPSLIEGLPGVILEAMHSKTPVVAYNVGGISEIVNEQTGSLVPKGDLEAFAQAVIEVLNKTDHVKLNKAYNLVKEHYTNKVISQKFLHLYGNLIYKSCKN